MAVTNSQVLADRMAVLRSHGITRDPSRMTHEPDGPWYYQQVELGFNYRMTEFQADLGIRQLDRLDDYVAQRHRLAEQYDAQLVKLPVQSPLHTNDEHYSALHLYVVRVIGLSVKEHQQLFQALREQGIGVNLHYIPVHTQPYYEQLGFAVGDFPNAEKYYHEAITLPLFPALKDAELEFIVGTLNRELM